MLKAQRKILAQWKMVSELLITALSHHGYVIQVKYHKAHLSKGLLIVWIVWGCSLIGSVIHDH